MYNVMIKVKDYGLLYKDGPEWEPTLKLTSKESGEEVVNLFRPSTIQGLLYRFLGDETGIYADKAKGELIEDPDLFELVDKAVFHLIQEPHVQNIYLRPGKCKQLPQFDLSSIDWHQANPLVFLLQDELIAASGEDTVEGAHASLQSSLADFRKQLALALKEKDVETLSKLIERYPIPKFEGFEAGKLGAAITKYTLDLETFFKDLSGVVEAITNGTEVKKLKPPYYSEVHHKFMLGVWAKAKNDSGFVGKLTDPKSKEARWSCFTSSGPQTRNWKDDKKINYYSRGAPGKLIKASFDIWIEDVSEGQLERFLNGPTIAPVGESGIAILDVTGETPPKVVSDDIFVTLRQLRGAGVKLRKRMWEYDLEIKNAQENLEKAQDKLNTMTAEKDNKFWAQKVKTAQKILKDVIKKKSDAVKKQGG